MLIYHKICVSLLVLDDVGNHRFKGNQGAAGAEEDLKIEHLHKTELFSTLIRGGGRTLTWKQSLTWFRSIDPPL